MFAGLWDLFRVSPIVPTLVTLETSSDNHEESSQCTDKPGNLVEFPDEPGGQPKHPEGNPYCPQSQSGTQISFPVSAVSRVLSVDSDAELRTDIIHEY